MAELYPWLVFVHLVGLVLFVAAHGVSMWASFAIRRSRDPALAAALLSLSQRATRHMYDGLVVLGIGGVGAAWVSNQLLAPWVIASYVVLAAVLVAMGAIATPYYIRLRRALEPSGATDAPVLDRLLASSRPVVLLVVGLAGLVVLVWLMVLKPG